MRVSRTKGKVTLEMFWICRYCGHKNPGLKGKEDESLRCESCGNQKSGDEEYVAPDDIQTAEMVTNERLLEYAHAGENWACNMCGSEERNTHKTCSVCGAPRSEAPPPEERRPAKPPRTPALPKPARRRVPILRTLLLGAFAIFSLGGIIYLLSFLFAVHETTATVTGVSWRRTEVLRQRETRDDGNAWEDDVPDGAFNKRCKEKQRRTEQCNEHKCTPGEDGYVEDDTVPCHCTGGGIKKSNCTTERKNCVDKGNGSMECDEVETCDETPIPQKCEKCPNPNPTPCYDECPVMDQWCSYSYYEWVVAKRKQTSGTDLNPHWPGLKAGNLQRIEREEWYEVNFNSEVGPRTHHPRTETVFRQYPVGATYRAKYNRADMFDPYERIE